MVEKAGFGTCVVHLRRRGGVEVETCDVYIGRAMFQGGWRLPASKWANPFRLSDYGNNRAACLAAYEKYLRASPGLLGALHELEGKRLGCWCVEKRCLTCGKARGACRHLDCHGDVLVKLLMERLVEGGEKSTSPSTDKNDVLPAGGPSVGIELTGAAGDLISDDDPIWAELGLAD